jgi:hypothetical protein
MTPYQRTRSHAQNPETARKPPKKPKKRQKRKN